MNMADHVRFQVVVLWANELRAASKAIALLTESTRDPDKFTEEQHNERLNNAFRACAVALRNVDSGDVLMVTEGDAGQFVPREVKVTRPKKGDRP
jgi:hypothetical protein